MAYWKRQKLPRAPPSRATTRTKVKVRGRLASSNVANTPDEHLFGEDCTLVFRYHHECKDEERRLASSNVINTPDEHHSHFSVSASEEALSCFSIAWVIISQTLTIYEKLFEAARFRK